MKILFVCLGNICRSPLAEAIFTTRCREKGLGAKFKAQSCGTAGYHIGEPPDPRTLRNAEENGIEIHHRGRQLTPGDLIGFDIVFAMDRSNLRDILRLEGASRYAGKIHLMREFDPQGKGKDVPDPYTGNQKEFQEVFDILNRSVDGLISYLTKAG
jgi:protein-tyrosine phosphatase